ncbi:gamma-glutamyl-gamma-aminobutyrate hydrolase family protein [Sulfuricurvum sp.]|uniref:gamma-glutamyl-gamma-aminobutyrate hydrolase family protein n=1 Tax=Sulfuricurvum sp. TaxID=2025608 RepID=UPI003BB5E736
MKTIIITPRIYRDSNSGEMRTALDMNWFELCKELNINLVVFSYMDTSIEFLRTLSLSGIILSGGNDLSSVNPSSENQIRDQYERSLVEFAVANEIPILGICRGMELLGEFFGGKVNPIKEHVRCRHEIFVTESRFGLIGGERNSYHDYALSESGVMRVIARSLDGSIEAIEHATLSIVGMMWHPEREKPFYESDKDCIRNFFGA